MESKEREWEEGWRGGRKKRMNGKETNVLVVFELC